VLIESLQKYLQKRYGFGAKENELIVTPGGRYAVYAALRSLLNEGDRCVVIEPNWPAYKEVIQFIGARATTIPTTLEEGWEPSVEKVKESIVSSTKAMVLSYPANPTGKQISTKLFDELVGVANDHKITIISDEIYTDYSYTECPSILKSSAERSILTASFSKTWAMTGFRVGYAVSSSETISRMAKMQALMVTSVPEFIQYGAIRALDAEDEVRANAEAMRERIEVASYELDKVAEFEHYRPDGAMYVFPRVKLPDFDASAFTMKVLEQKKVSISPGVGFGDYPDCFRISLGNSKETIAEGIRRLGETLR
jgi:aspartate aminotransferase